MPFPGAQKAEEELSECSELTTTTTTTTTTPSTTSHGYHPSQLPQEPSYILSLFSSQQQHDLFAVFVFSNSQAGTLPVNTLSALTPQLAHANLAVREMCCAIGAAAAAFTVPGTPAAVDEVQYEASLRHYNRALRAVRAAVPERDALLTVALVSILFVTYDMLRGDMKTAFAHFNHGRRIIDSYFDARCRDAGQPLSQLRLSTLEAAVFEMLQRLTTHPWVLDLDQQGTRLDGHRELSHACCRSGRHRGRVRDLPESFRDLAAALRWWDVVQHFLLHQLQATHASSSSSPEPSPSPSEPSPSSTSSPPSRPMPDSAWNASLSALRSWHNSFSPLLQSARLHKSTDPYRYLNACTLETLYLESLTSLHARHGGGDVDVLPDVKRVYLDMVQTTRQMQQRYARSTFLDNAIMRPLTYVAYKSVDTDVREGIREVLEGSVGASHMAAPLRSMMNRKRGEAVPQKMRNIERAMGWYFTSCGVTQVL